LITMMNGALGPVFRFGGLGRVCGQTPGVANPQSARLAVDTASPAQKVSLKPAPQRRRTPGGQQNARAALELRPP